MRARICVGKIALDECPIYSRACGTDTEAMIGTRQTGDIMNIPGKTYVTPSTTDGAQSLTERMRIGSMRRELKAAGFDGAFSMSTWEVEEAYLRLYGAPEEEEAYWGGSA